MEKLLELSKQSLSISNSSTIRDGEISMYILAAIKDLERLGTRIDLENPLLQTAVILYVKANFGFVDDREKERSKEIYNSIRAELSISDGGDGQNV